MVVAKVIGIFVIVFVGYGANKLGWLPVESSRYFSALLINICVPCILIMSVSEQELNSENIRSILLMFFIAVVGYIAQWYFSKLFIRLRRIPRTEWGAYTNAFVFSNNGFIGFAVSLAVFGKEGLFLMAMMNSVMPFFLYTFGAANFRKDAATVTGVLPERKGALTAFRKAINPPIVSVIVGLGIFFLRVPIPVAIGDVLSSIGEMMTPLSMLVIGLQLTQSSPREMLQNKNLLLTVLCRLIILPAIAFLILLPFHLPALITAVATLSFLLPCAAILPAIAEEAGAKAKLSTEMVFLSTLFSIITVPVASVLLHLL